MRYVKRPNTASSMPASRMVQIRHGYYTGSKRNPIKRWTTFPKFAKVSRGKAWKKRITAQLGGRVVTAAEQKHDTFFSDRKTECLK